MISIEERIYTRPLNCLALLLVVVMSIVFTPVCDGGDSPPLEKTLPSGTPIPSPASVTVDQKNTFDVALWNDPRMENRPYIRWWWPGGAVDPQQLKAELRLLKEYGFGGVEVQPFIFGLSPEEIEINPDIRTVGTLEFFEKLSIAAEEAQRIGMGFDVTFGSGWPTGVPNAADAAEKQLLMCTLEINGPAEFRGPLPAPAPPAYRERVNALMNVVGPCDENLRLVAVTAAELVDKDAPEPVLDSFLDLTEFVEDDVLNWSAPEGNWLISAFYENNTSHAPVGGAFPGSWYDALIIDTFDSSGARKLIDNYGDPLLETLVKYAPDAIFVDSFEMVGELPWTSSFPEQFEELKGYDLRPYLPLLFRVNGESKYTIMTDLMAGFSLAPVFSSLGEEGIRVREDYEDARATMFIEEFVEPLAEWVNENGMKLRLQAQGGWADYLDVYQMADIPESEGLFAGGTYDFLKLASSAAHKSGSRFVGCEAFVMLSPDPKGFTLEDFHLLGGRALSAGINRIIYHGFPYEYTRANGKEWYPFTGELGTVRAGPLPINSWIGENHPVWSEIPSFNEYLSRLSYAMSTGNHSAQIAWLYPEWEFPDNPMDTRGGLVPEDGESEISLSLKRAGFVYDRTSRQNLVDTIVEEDHFTVGSARYQALLISDLHVASVEMMNSIEDLANSGIPVVVTGTLPDRAPGYMDFEARDIAVQEASQQLVSQVIFADKAARAVSELSAAGVQPLLRPVDGSSLPFVPESRQADNGHIILLFNESDNEQTQILEILVPAKQVQVFDPQTGGILSSSSPDEFGALSIEVAIPARRSVILFAQS